MRSVNTAIMILATTTKASDYGTCPEGGRDREPPPAAAAKVRV